MGKRVCLSSLMLLVVGGGGGVSAPFFLLFVIDCIYATSFENYRSQRAILLQEENAAAYGSCLQFQPGERAVNDILMAAKREELLEGFRRPSSFGPSRNFLESSKHIERSKVFRLIRKMPKGAVLHSHASAIVSNEFVFNITYRENLYICEVGRKPGVTLALRFFDKPNNACDWKLLSELRADPEKKKSLDLRIAKQLSMLDPAGSASSIRNYGAWSRFMKILKFMSPMLKFRPVHEDHFYRGLEELRDDRVIYLELRATLHPVYELNGTVHQPVEVARIYRDTAERFVRDNPSFVGVKLIYAPMKTSSPREFDEYLRIAERLKKLLPNFFVGFDLVGQEDASPPLSNWSEKLLILGQKNIPFFFHAGETNWNGMSVDDDLLDAVLLNTKRIGHGYALIKHPKILEIVKKNKIAVEICPISNQVLGLVGDLRNHPASVLFAENFPVVVSNDDPGLWGARALSYDFYEAFVGIMSAHADLRAIKQLAINSIQYSSLCSAEKIRALSIWNEQWNVFIKSFRSKE